MFLRTFSTQPIPEPSPALTMLFQTVTSGTTTQHAMNSDEQGGRAKLITTVEERHLQQAAFAAGQPPFLHPW